MPGNVTFQEWQANPALQHSQPVFAHGEFIMYLKGVMSMNPIIQNTFAMHNPGGAVHTGRSYYQVSLPLNHPERITNTRSLLESSMIIADRNTNTVTYDAKRTGQTDCGVRRNTSLSQVCRMSTLLVLRWCGLS